MRLRAEGSGIEGEIGHVARHFRPVAAEAVPAAAQGHWRCPAYHAGFDIEGETLATGIGPARMTARLRPLGEGACWRPCRMAPGTSSSACALRETRWRWSAIAAGCCASGGVIPAS
ncbi:hypothetical protein ACFQU7_20220 [Pseudoroseomonas wenyumeiae]